MNERGYIVLEAVIGLAITALMLTAAQQLAGTAISNRERAEARLKQALRLEQLETCLGRIRDDLPQPGEVQGPAECTEFEVLAAQMLTKTLGSVTIRDRQRLISQDLSVSILVVPAQ